MPEDNTLVPIAEERRRENMRLLIKITHIIYTRLAQTAGYQPWPADFMMPSVIRHSGWMLRTHQAFFAKNPVHLLYNRLILSARQERYAQGDWS